MRHSCGWTSLTSELLFGQDNIQWSHWSSYIKDDSLMTNESQVIIMMRLAFCMANKHATCRSPNLAKTSHWHKVGASLSSGCQYAKYLILTHFYQIFLICICLSSSTWRDITLFLFMNELFFFFYCLLTNRHVGLNSNAMENTHKK